MVLSNDTETTRSDEPIRVSAYSITLICKNCGKAYISRGKHDPGICRDCERTNPIGDEIMIGGPLNGQRVG